MLGIEPSALLTLGNCSVTDLYHQHLSVFFSHFPDGQHPKAWEPLL